MNSPAKREKPPQGLSQKYLRARLSFSRGFPTPGSALPDLLAIGLLAFLTMVFFSRLIFVDGVWMPRFGGDLAGFLYPTYHFAAESLKQGKIPLWNPYLYAGAPHVADIQSGVFYPINLVAFFLTDEVTYRLMEGLAGLHFFLAGASMYLCLRLLRPTANGQRLTHHAHQEPVVGGRGSSAAGPIARTACLLGAVSLMFSDFFVNHFGNLNLIAVAAWLPLVFLGTYRALHDRSIGWAMLGGTCLGIAALAGHAQPLQFMALVMALYTVFHLLNHWRRGGRWALQTLGLAGFIGLVGLGWAALSLLPALELVSFTRRASLTYAEAAQHSLPPQALMGLLVPDFFGRGVAGFWAPWPRVEVGYIGVLPALLGMLAVALRWRERLVQFLAGLALLSLLVALGAYTPFHRWVYDFVPGFQNLRVPARLIYVMDFAWAALAALGLDALLRSKCLSEKPLEPVSRPWPLARSEAGQSTFRASPQHDVRRFMRAVPWISLLLAVIVLVSSFYFSRRYQPTPPRLTAAVRGLLIFAIWLGTGTILIMSRARGRLHARLFGGLCVALTALDLILLGAGVDVGHENPALNYDRPRVVAFLQSDPSLYRIEVRPEVWGWWGPDAALIHGIQDAGGVYNPLRLSDYQLYWESLTDRATRLYDFLNVKYLIAPPNFGLPWDKFAPVLDDGDLTVYLNREALPRVLMVYDVHEVADQTEAFRAVHANGFDPTRRVVLEAGQIPAHRVAEPQTPPRLAFAGYDLNSLAVDVTTETPGYLVISDVWYPGWYAQVDDTEVPVLRANYAFRAVPVPAGSHRVHLRFSPRSWRIGVAISAGTWMGVLLATVWLARRKWWG